MIFKAYTSYPLDDTSYKVREVTVLSYDRDKYCDVDLDGVTYALKAGYVYADPGMSKLVPRHKWYSLPLELGGKHHTRFEVAEVIRRKANKRTSYELCIDDSLEGTRYFRSLRDAMHAVAPLLERKLVLTVFKETCTGDYSQVLPILSGNRNGALTIYSDHKGRTDISRGTLARHGIR